jgi:sterol desaturase/sphingolipid hydroxylase (fatty acid hydroxylase superfamily)
MFKKDTKCPKFKTVFLDLMYSLSNFLIAIVVTLTLGKIIFLLFPTVNLYIEGLEDQSPFIQFILILLVIDFNAYWVHRLMHSKSFWPLHAIHHSSPTLYWLAAERSHPLNNMLGLFLSFEFLSFNFSSSALTFSGLFYVIYGYFIHTGVPFHYGFLNKVFVSPLYHHWHHSKEKIYYNANYAGMFSLYDCLFGTYHMKDSPGVPTAIGVGDENLKESLSSQLNYPIRMAISYAKKR